MGLAGAVAAGEDVEISQVIRRGPQVQAWPGLWAVFPKVGMDSGVRVHYITVEARMVESIHIFPKYQENIVLLNEQSLLGCFLEDLLSGLSLHA